MISKANRIKKQKSFLYYLKKDPCNMTTYGEAEIKGEKNKYFITSAAFVRTSHEEENPELDYKGTIPVDMLSVYVNDFDKYKKIGEFELKKLIDKAKAIGYKLTPTAASGRIQIEDMFFLKVCDYHYNLALTNVCANVIDSGSKFEVKIHRSNKGKYQNLLLKNEIGEAMILNFDPRSFNKDKKVDEQKIIDLEELLEK